MKRARDDARPAWLLRKLATISRTRQHLYGDPPADYMAWWSQIVATQVTLQLETKPGDWQPWPL